MIAHDEYRMLEREVEVLATDLDAARAEVDRLRGKVAYYIREARYHRDCERLCAREYDRLAQKRGRA